MFVYVVRGSEDGTIGACGSRAKARKACEDYLRQNNASGRIVWDECKYYGSASIIGDRASAEYEQFYLN